MLCCCSGTHTLRAFPRGGVAPRGRFTPAVLPGRSGSVLFLAAVSQVAILRAFPIKMEACLWWWARGWVASSGAPSLPLSLSDHYSAMLADALELCNVGNARGEGGKRLLFAARFGEGAAPASEASASAHAFI